jgi:class 3 adenylate cyclase/TolB-like protein
VPTRVDGAVRRLAAVWFADIVGYTRLSAKDENAALLLVTLLQQCAKQEIEAHSGRLVKLIGDAILAEFSSTGAAVRAALGLQEQFAVASAAAGIEAKLRIGVHVGDVVGTEDGDLYGDGINTASRVQGQARPGQVLVTQDVWHQLRQRRDYRFESIGERELKGLPGPLWLFTVTLAGADQAAAAVTPALPQNRSVRWARLVRVALAYVVVSAVLLQITGMLRNRLELPDWVTPVGALLLLVGLVVMAATAWVQSRPTWERRVGEDTDPWRVDVKNLATSVAHRRFPTLTWGRALLGGALAFSVLFGAAGTYVALKSGVTLPSFAPQSAQAQPGLGLAILPFEASGTEPGLWEEGMVDLLALNLDGAAGVRVIDPRSVLSRWREHGGVADSAMAVRLARQLGARFAMAGRTEATAERIEIVADLYDTETGEVLGHAAVAGPPESLPELIDRFALQVLQAGVASAGTGELPALDLGRLATSSLPALRAYLVGTQDFRRSRWMEAQNAFRNAIDADSTFAQALYRMSLARSWASQPHALGRDLFGDAARRHSGRLPERDRLLVQAYDELNRSSSGAIATLEHLTALYPDDVEGWFLLGDAYYHLGGGGRAPARRPLP